MTPLGGCAVRTSRADDSRGVKSTQSPSRQGYTGERLESIRRFVFLRALMGVQCRIVVYHWDENSAKLGAEAAFERIGQLNQVLSDYLPDSEVNHWFGDEPASPSDAMSHDLESAIRLSNEVSEKTNGAFDITVGPLTRIWRDARSTGEWPRSEVIEDALRSIGFRKLRYTPNAGWKATEIGMHIDFGGIGKGLAADEAARVLIDHECPYSLIDLGGDIVANYSPPGKDGWTVQVHTGRAPVKTITIALKAVATSGDSEQYMIHNGARYSHIIDPRTGYPLRNSPTVTVIAPNGALADALASAVSVLGEEQWNEIASRFEGVEVIVHAE